MLGQGSPTADWGTLRRAATRVVLGCACALVAASSQLVAANAATIELRLRVEWGGPPRLWSGEISIEGGQFANHQSLGIEADEPGSMWIEGSRLVIRSRSPRQYDGVDFTVTADEAAELVIELRSPENLPAAEPVRVPLGHLIDQTQDATLADQATRLLAHRAPGDRLRVKLATDSLVFSPGDPFRFDARPHLLPFPPGSKVLLTARLTPARGTRSLWSETKEFVAAAVGAEDPTLPWSIVLPDEEGVYDLVLSAERGGLSNRLALRHQVEERRVQLVVIGRHAPAAVAGASSDMELLTEIDPGAPNWWERMANISWLPGSRRGPMGSGDAVPWQHPLGTMIQLGPSGREPNIAWEAYPLPVGQPGQPHIVEVDYPSNSPQSLGLSIVEPNALGAVQPIGLDSGFHLPIEAAADEQRMLTHRLVFWPRTSAPVLLLTNRRDGTRAVYGKIRLLGPKPRAFMQLGRPASDRTRLPRALPLGTKSERLLAAYLDRPLLAENFGAGDSPNLSTGQVLNDWLTFYEGATRLVEYLEYVGYNGMVLSVLADGSSIYPSRLIEPTPRYDDGVFFASGQDPVRKDVLELLLRLFDRAELKLIPSLEFAAPLPALESISRSPDASGANIALVGEGGRPWLAMQRSRNGLAPYYNPLEPRVQAAMIAVVGELAARYGKHPSLAGLAIKLSADGYTHFPSEAWGADDDTLARFLSARAPNQESLTPADARPRLAAGTMREEWLDWRVSEMAAFYTRLRKLFAGTSERPLYLNGADLFDRPDLRASLEPALPRTTSTVDLLRGMALDPERLTRDGRIVFPRAQRIAPVDDLTMQAANIELNQSTELDQSLAATQSPASLFFH